MNIPETVTVKNLEWEKDHIFIEVGKSHPVTGLVKNPQGELVGYYISTPRGKYAVTLDQIECSKQS